MSYEVQKYSWRLSSQHKIYAQMWKTNLPAKGILGIHHGMGGHIGLYEHVATIFLKEGYHVIGLDQIGHGQSEGKRGDTPKYALMLESINHMVNTAKKQFPSLPFVLYGHSMGGNIVLRYIY